MTPRLQWWYTNRQPRNADAICRIFTFFGPRAGLRDPLTGKWVRARYVAERNVIAERYAEFEIIGPPEIRDVDLDARYFNPAGGEPVSDRAAVGNVGAVIAIARSGERPRLVVAGIAV